MKAKNENKQKKKLEETETCRGKKKTSKKVYLEGARRYHSIKPKMETIKMKLSENMKEFIN